MFHFYNLLENLPLLTDKFLQNFVLRKETSQLILVINQDDCLLDNHIYYLFQIPEINMKYYLIYIYDLNSLSQHLLLLNTYNLINATHSYLNDSRKGIYNLLKPFLQLKLIHVVHPNIFLFFQLYQTLSALTQSVDI